MPATRELRSQHDTSQTLGEIDSVIKSNREANKKRLERMYLDCFLRMSGIQCAVEETEPSQAPDFYLHSGGVVSALEMRRLFWNEGRQGGSVTKKAESRRHQTLIALRDVYHGRGGPPVAVQANVPDRVDRSSIEQTATRLVSIVAKMRERASIRRTSVPRSPKRRRESPRIKGRMLISACFYWWRIDCRLLA